MLKIIAEGPQGSGKSTLLTVLGDAGWKISEHVEADGQIVIYATPTEKRLVRGEMVNWYERRDDFLGWAIIHLMSAATGKKRPWKDAFEGADSKALQIELKINGVECSFTELIERIDGDLDRMVAERALKLVEQKFNGIFDLADGFQRKAREMLGLQSED